MNPNRGFLVSIDWKLMVPTFVLVILSLMTLFSVNAEYFRNQLLYLVISGIFFVFFSQVHYKIADMYGSAIYILSLVLLLIVLILGIESRGAIRWLDIFGLRIQFSEILKPFLAISLASYLSKKELSFKTFFLTLVFMMPIVLLIFVQPDLGSALIYVLSTLLTLVSAGFPLWWFLGGFVSLVALLPLGWRFLHDYQQQRITAFINPTSDPLGTSYNAIQAVIAVGSGMFFGKGLSERTQSGLQFLPEHHTDFIFATIAEGLGFFGVVVILVAFGFLLYRIYEICRDSDDMFCKMYSAFSFSVIAVQFFLNVGMNIGIVPVVGITLPFVSFGGSSLLSNFILLGFLSSIGNVSKRKEVLEIR